MLELDRSFADNDDFIPSNLELLQLHEGPEQQVFGASILETEILVICNIKTLV